MSVKITCLSAAKWRRYAHKKISSARDGVLRTFIDGFLIVGRSQRRRVSGLILDIPPKVLFRDAPYGAASAALMESPFVPIHYSRDLFNPDYEVDGSPDRDFTEGDMETDGLPPEVYLGAPPPDTVRYVTTRWAGHYTGSGFYRASTVFNCEQQSPDFWPLTDAPKFWARADLRGVKPGSFLRLCISEDHVAAITGGYRFFTRALGLFSASAFPQSTPVVTCDRRQIGEIDRAVVAIPVTKNLGDFDEDNNNRDLGYGAVLFLILNVLKEGSRPVGVEVIDYHVVGSEDESSGALAVQEWSEDINYTGVMPNRLHGDVTLTEAGDIFWAGVWESSREIEESDNGPFASSFFLPIWSTVRIDIPNAGNPTVTKLYTTVVTNDEFDDPSGSANSYNYRTLYDTAPASPIFPFNQKFHCFSPPGVVPFFTAESLYMVRDSIYDTEAAVAGPGSSGLVFGRGGAMSYLTVPDGSFYFPPFTRTVILVNETSAGPRHALVDANKQRPKVGFIARSTPDMSLARWVELDVEEQVLALIGEFSVGGTSWEVLARVTCYQRGESINEPDGTNTPTHPAALLLTYGYNGEGDTKISRDGGVTWVDVARYAARNGAFYFGSGFYGRSLDKIYYEVNDNV